MNSMFKYIMCFAFLSISVSTFAVNDSICAETSIGYDVQERYKTSSAISSVRGNELSKSFTPNLLNSLAGRLPGLTISQGSDEAGVIDNKLFIRGLGTFQGLTEPLIVIDGFVTQYIDGDGYLRTLLSQLMPEEIESVTLLKDASATAIYGLRGANGVLLINTKRGLNSPLKINFTAQIGFQQPTRMPNFLDSYDYARLYNEAYGYANNGAQFYDEDALNAYKNGTDKYLYPNVDWYDETLRKTAEMYKVGLNFQGGNNIVKYLANILMDNTLIKKILLELEKNKKLTLKQVKNILISEMPFIDATDKIWEQYSKVMCKWLSAAEMMVSKCWKK